MGLSHIPRDYDLFNIFSIMTYFKIDCSAVFITYSTLCFRQIPPSNSLELMEFETYYIEPNPRLFFANKICNCPSTCPFSLHTMLEGPWLDKTAFPTPMVWPLDESQGSSPLQGHGSWLMCEVAMIIVILETSMYMIIWVNYRYW